MQGGSARKERIKNKEDNDGKNGVVEVKDGDRRSLPTEFQPTPRNSVWMTTMDRKVGLL